MEESTLIPLTGEAAIEAALRDFMHILLDSGISTEETLKQGFLFAEGMFESIRVEKHYWHIPEVDNKMHAALTLRGASRALGIDLQSQRSSSEKQ